MCFKRREKPARIVSGLSVLVFLCGLAGLINSAIYLDKDIFNINEDWRGVSIDSLAGVMVAFSVAAMVVGLAGMFCCCDCIAKCKIFPAVLYGLSMTVIWIVLVVIGAILTYTSFVWPEQLEATCNFDGPQDTQLQPAY